MSSPDSPTPRANASKWNARYAYAKKDLPPACDVLLEAGEYLPSTGDALDLACGRGGNAFHLAAKGLSVKAWDSSQTAIDWLLEYKASNATQLDIHPQVRDVISKPPEASSFDVIVVSRFLDRQLCAAIADALKPNGVLYYQTFTAGLSNPNYLLQPGELATLFAPLTKLFAKETALNDAGFSEALYVGRNVAPNAAQKPDHE